MTSVVLTIAAKADLAETCQFIASDNVAAADRLLQRVDTAIAKLSEMPEIGHQRQDVTDRRYRFFTVHPYLIVYRYESPIVTVVRFLHGARHISRIMEERP